MGNESVDPSFCKKVREALVSGIFEEVGRDQVEEHLGSHSDCMRWASDWVLMSHILSGKSSRSDSHQIPLDQIEGILQRDPAPKEVTSPHESTGIRWAPDSGGALEDRLQGLLGSLDLKILSKLGDLVPTEDSAYLKATLAGRGLRSLALGSRGSFEKCDDRTWKLMTPDGRLQVTVSEFESGEGPRISLGIALHEKSWTGRRAFYRLSDISGKPEAAGMVQILEEEAAVVISDVQPEQGSRNLLVKVLGIDDGALLKKIVVLLGDDFRFTESTAMKK